MSAVASGLSFEVLRFTVEPVSAEVALLELEGRFRAETRRRLGVPRLMAETDDGSSEVAPAAAGEAQAEPDGGLWRASYAVALDLLDDGSFALAVGRELLVGLPAPDLAETSGEREVRLAREANALRRTADEARAAAAAALASVGTERQAREATEAEMAEARMARDDHARRAVSLDEDLSQLRREHAAELVRRDEERAAALAGRDEEAARAADERVAELEAEAAEVRRGLRAARAEAEAMRRDLERERERAEAAEAAVRRGRITELDGEPVKAWEADDERPTTVVAPDGEEALAAARADAHEDETDVFDPPAAEAATEIAERPPGRAVPGDDRSEDATEIATTKRSGSVAGDPGETVRVLGARRPRRTGEGTPAEAAPGTAAIGARHIEPGQTPQRSAVAAWLARALAFAALAVVVVALLLVVKPF
ncbi:MAG TPA: hypothetical protein VLK59_13565 [Solirubrobacteraceae bacterium]|nr:hypothetical protein [Solirubrobacteraceae bacterium]